MNNKEKVYSYLQKNNIDYSISEHPPIDTIADLDQYDISNKSKIAKNLFLRNDNGKKHYLITISQEKQVDLKKLRKRIGSSRLSFASEERLMKHLGLKKGSVTPLGIINNEDREVEVYFDEDLINEEIIGVHPNENDATIWLSFENLKGIVKQSGNKFGTVKID